MRRLKRKRPKTRQPIPGFWGVWQSHYARQNEFVGWFSSPGRAMQRIAALTRNALSTPHADEPRFSVVHALTIAEAFLSGVDRPA